jgi:hypothetical protein
MFYAKNMPGWERIARVSAAAGLIAWGLLGLKGLLLGYLVAGSGVVMALTGLMGYCPMCAMVGRKLKE